MEKKPLTMRQKKNLCNIGNIIGYALLIFGLMMGDLSAAMTWVGFALLVVLSVFRVFAFRCPECGELIPSRFGIVSKTCAKCGWDMDWEESES